MSKEPKPFADTLPVHFRRACSAISADGGLRGWLDARYGAEKWALCDYPRGDIEIALSSHAYASSRRLIPSPRRPRSPPQHAGLPMSDDQAEPLTVQILKDVLDGIEHFYGSEGLELVAGFARGKNRARESNKLIDDLDALYGAPTVASQQRSTPGE